MNERFKEVRKTLGLTQSEFGKSLGISNTAISKIEKGENNVSESNIISICREFGVNEEWLRTGVGGENNMFIKLSAYDKAYNRFGYVMENASASKKAALTMLLELVYRTSDEEWDLIMKEIDEIKKGEV
ncbi:helix-turn-helix domain-containing protein [Anaerobutyricum soehngenii]|uniref:helix-turn-helix domain-containing protein n=1 Tax=Anaerobutyricum soehngenii TaxID=105843 RepID=UPI001C124336|nr:helix-turn-helix transcriptional regulator [Anaerobutyricum soehngenii]MBU5416505.1 helix-turn-helix domain-containing protein [Anaerobutyricum soehngenii]